MVKGNGLSTLLSNFLPTLPSLYSQPVVMDLDGVTLFRFRAGAFLHVDVPQSGKPA